jgi:hypothetical protein
VPRATVAPTTLPMSANGTYNHSQDTPSSPSGSVSPISSLADASPRRSLEDDDAGDRAPNGHGSLNGRKHQPRDSQGSLSQVQMLEMELEETRKEKEALAMQYQNLLGRLTAMRTTLGNKLKLDAVCFTIDVVFFDCMLTRSYCIGRTRPAGTAYSAANCPTRRSLLNSRDPPRGAHPLTRGSRTSI